MADDARVCIPSRWRIVRIVADTPPDDFGGCHRTVMIQCFSVRFWDRIITGTGMPIIGLHDDVPAQERASQSLACGSLQDKEREDSLWCIKSLSCPWCYPFRGCVLTRLLAGIIPPEFLLRKFGTFSYISIIAALSTPAIFSYIMSTFLNSFLFPAHGYTPFP